MKLKKKFMLPLNIQLFAEGAEPIDVPVEPVEPQPTTEPTGVIDEPAEPVEPQPTNEPVKPVQSQEDNAKFAAARREAEAEKRRIEAENQRLLQVLNKSGYSGSALEIADIIEAQLSQKPIEQVRAEREAQEQQTAKEMQLQAEVEELKQYKFSKLIEGDIAEINKAYPTANIKSVQDLGTDYLNIMRLGQVDCVTAYEILQAKKAKTEIAKPPITGATNQSTPTVKEFYTREEVDMLTEEDFNNPQIYKAVKKSQTKWKY